jgi:hypothetical protein
MTFAGNMQALAMAPVSVAIEPVPASDAADTGAGATACMFPHVHVLQAYTFRMNVSHEMAHGT